MNDKTKFEDIYNAQLEFQKLLTRNGFNSIPLNAKLPIDDIGMFSQHVQHLISEIGEVLAADKRWKNYRNDKFDKANKLEELADCFIVLLNLCIYSGIESSELEEMIKNKIMKNKERIDEMLKQS